MWTEWKWKFIYHSLIQQIFNKCLLGAWDASQPWRVAVNRTEVAPALPRAIRAWGPSMPRRWVGPVLVRWSGAWKERETMFHLGNFRRVLKRGHLQDVAGMAQNPTTSISSSFQSHQRWWIEAGLQVVEHGRLGREKELPTGSRLTSP